MRHRPRAGHDIDVQMWVDAGTPASYAVTAAPLPEPTTLLLLGTGALVTLLPLRRRRQT